LRVRAKGRGIGGKSFAYMQGGVEAIEAIGFRV
jgi:hypothetical protein